MSSIFEDNLEEFHSALQLSIDTKVVTILLNPEVISVSLETKKKLDERWEYFERITGGNWNRENKIPLYQIPQGVFNLNELTQFLFVTRLRKENMLKIVEIHPEYKKYVEKIFGASQLHSTSTIKTLEDCKRLIFEEIARRNLTLLNLAHQTGLSLVSLSNFKSGKDIRLTTFLKIAEALALRLEFKKS